MRVNEFLLCADIDYEIDVPHNFSKCVFQPTQLTKM